MIGRYLLQQVNTEQVEEPIFPLDHFQQSERRSAGIQEQETGRGKKNQEPHWCLVGGQRGTEEPVAGRGEVFEGYSGKRKTKEKLRSEENKNEHEA